ELEQKIKDGTLPTPFHPGAQWAGESPAEPATDAGATTASAAPVSEPDKAVDPLVGLWVESSLANSMSGHKLYKWCFLAVGQDREGVLKAATWVPVWSTRCSGGYHQWAHEVLLSGGHPWAGRKKDLIESQSVVFSSAGRSAYDWTIEKEMIQNFDFNFVHWSISFDTQCMRVFRGARSGRLTIAEDAGKAALRSSEPLCGGAKAEGSDVFHRITANGAAVLDLPEWYKQQVEAGTMPSPFVGMDQWSKAPAAAKAKVEKIPQSTDNEPQEFKETGR
ncbi:MAG: hypothetical protein VYD25_09835, partial [Pseudomonadota bacterium]|nr:hypothetical protein [Pseudomonadota bacterium]